MTNIEAKIIHGLIKKENRVKAVEISGFVTMLKQEDKCNDELVNDVNEYIGMLSLLHNKFEGVSLYKLQKRGNPIDEKDFARLTKYSIELNAFMDLAKEKMK